jgi:hypothetical protein
LLAGVIALGGLVPAAAVGVLAVRAHEKASALLSAGLPELTAEYHARAHVLLEVGVFCLLAGGAFIALILLSIKGSRAGGTFMIVTTAPRNAAHRQTSEQRNKGEKEETSNGVS